MHWVAVCFRLWRLGLPPYVLCMSKQCPAPCRGWGDECFKSEGSDLDLCKLPLTDALPVAGVGCSSAQGAQGWHEPLKAKRGLDLTAVDAPLPSQSRLLCCTLMAQLQGVMD